MAYDYKFYYGVFSGMVKLAAEWTTDMRGLNSNANPVFDALYKMKHWDEMDHSVKMTEAQQRNIVGCLKTVSWAASHATTNSRVLAIDTMSVLNALNQLFLKEGLIPIQGIYE